MHIVFVDGHIRCLIGTDTDQPSRCLAPFLNIMRQTDIYQAHGPILWSGSRPTCFETATRRLSSSILIPQSGKRDLTFDAINW